MRTTTKKASSRRIAHARAGPQGGAVRLRDLLVRLFVLEQAPQAVVPEHGRSKKGSARNRERYGDRGAAEAGEQASDADVSPFERRGGPFDPRTFFDPSSSSSSSTPGFVHQKHPLRRRSMTMTSARIARPVARAEVCRAGARDGPARLGLGEAAAAASASESDDDGSDDVRVEVPTTFGSGARLPRRRFHQAVRRRTSASAGAPVRRGPAARGFSAAGGSSAAPRGAGRALRRRPAHVSSRAPKSWHRGHEGEGSEGGGEEGGENGARARGARARVGGRRAARAPVEEVPAHELRRDLARERGQALGLCLEKVVNGKSYGTPGPPKRGAAASGSARTSASKPRAGPPTRSWRG